MWFSPVREKPHLDKESLLIKVNNITEVVIACKDTGLDWFEQLLQSVSLTPFAPKCVIAWLLPPPFKLSS